MYQPFISDHQPGNIDCQIAVAFQQVSYREYKEYECQQQYRIKRIVRKIDPVHEPDDSIAQCHTKQSAYDQLGDK